uniref:Uncharacterized protein n=1 Tax=Cacopsylla melanoneura TaxID=428564 RepID=A0A8D9B9R9_9HEMI
MLLKKKNMTRNGSKGEIEREREGQTDTMIWGRKGERNIRREERESKKKISNIKVDGNEECETAGCEGICENEEEGRWRRKLKEYGEELLEKQLRGRKKKKNYSFLNQANQFIGNSGESIYWNKKFVGIEQFSLW